MSRAGWSEFIGMLFLFMVRPSSAMFTPPIGNVNLLVLLGKE